MEESEGRARLLLWRRRQCAVFVAFLFLTMVLTSTGALDSLDRRVAFPVTVFVAFVAVFHFTWWLFAAILLMLAIAAWKGWIDRYLKVVTITAWAWTLLLGLGYASLVGEEREPAPASRLRYPGSPFLRT